MEVSHADRIVFPAIGVTKGDVVDYYAMVGEEMLPYVEGRALTVERYPKGTGAKGFMQKNAPDHFSDELIDRHEVPREGGGITTYPVIRDTNAITAFANLGVITFHVPPGKVDAEFSADWIIWDLDPAAGDFSAARRAASGLRSVLESFGIDTILMTSGSNGYHLRTALKPALPSDDAAMIARGTAALAEAAHPDLMTLAFRKKERGDRVFVDWLRNAPYSTSVVPWSLRAREVAPVAAPISWEELDDVDPNGVTMDEVGKRLHAGVWDRYELQDLTDVRDTIADALTDAGIELEPFDRFRSR